MCQSYPPMVSGQSFMVERLALGSAKKGHQVMVISASDRSKAYTTTRGGIRLVRLKSLPNPLRVGQRFSALGIREMKAAFEEFQPDVVHLHDLTNVGLVGVALAHSLGIPVVMTMHGMPWLVSAYLSKLKLPAVSHTLENISWAYVRQALQRCDVIVAPSKAAAREIRAKVRRNALVVSNGVDLERFTNTPLSRKEEVLLRKKIGLPENAPVILHAGRLDGEKNVSAVVRAVALALRENEEAHLVLAGDGVEREELEELAEELGIRNRCHFLGFIDAKKELPKLFRLARLFVTASEMEVQSLVLLEVIASGLPVVAVDATSVSEMVEHGKSGLLVRSGDERGMAQAILRLLDEKTAQTFGRRARTLAQKHALEETFAGYNTLYRKLAKTRQRAK